MTIQTISGKKSPLRSGEFQETIADGLNGNPMQVPLIFSVLYCSHINWVADPMGKIIFA